MPKTRRERLGQQGKVVYVDVAAAVAGAAGPHAHPTTLAAPATHAAQRTAREVADAVLVGVHREFGVTESKKSISLSVARRSELAPASFYSPSKASVILCPRAFSLLLILAAAVWRSGGGQ